MCVHVVVCNSLSQAVSSTSCLFLVTKFVVADGESMLYLRQLCYHLSLQL